MKYIDFYFLQSKTYPDFNYLKKIANLGDWKDLKKEVDKKIKDLNFKALSRDVEKFLFNRKDIEKVTCFKEYFNDIITERIK